MSSQITISECRSDEERRDTFPVMHQLRPHLEEATYLELIASLYEDGARLIAGRLEGRIVGCAVFRSQFRLSIGRLIYIDDLVTDQNTRSSGVGAAMLDWIETEGRRLGANFLVLDSGTGRREAHRFYLRERFDITSFNFKKPL